MPRGISKTPYKTKKVMSQVAKIMGQGRWVKGRKGEMGNHWKGDSVKYEGLHAWILRNFGKASKCENKNCKYPRIVNDGREILTYPKRFEWANISGKYKRDINDFFQLCPSCRRK